MTGTITLAAATGINRGRVSAVPPHLHRSVCVMFVAADAAVSHREDWRLPRDYTVIDASSLEAAVSLAQGHAPDLLILELGLPADPGLAMLRQLKAHPDLGIAPLVLFGAYADMSTIRRGLELGARDYFITGETEPWVVARRIPAWLDDSARPDFSHRSPGPVRAAGAQTVITADPASSHRVAALFAGSLVGLLPLLMQKRFLVLGHATKHA